MVSVLRLSRSDLCIIALHLLFREWVFGYRTHDTTNCVGLIEVHHNFKKEKCKPIAAIFLAETQQVRQIQAGSNISWFSTELILISVCALPAVHIA